MPAMTAFTQLLHLFNSSLPPFPARTAAPPTPCPKERALFGASNKSQNGDVARSLSRSPEAHKRAMLFNPAYPHKCARFSFWPHWTCSRSPSRHKRSTCPYLNSQWQSIISAVWRRRWLTAPSLCSALLELQVLLFPAAFQCAGLADRTKEEDDHAARARRLA